jgi:hypothetical protein
VRLGALTVGTIADACSPTQAYLLALPPGFLLTFLAQVKFISLVGEDYRKKDSSSPELF